MNKSDQINELAKSLSACQSEIEGAEKNKKNPAFGGNKYADLSSVWEAARTMTKHGLSVVQTGDVYKDEGDRVILTTTLLHESGQWISGTMSATPVKKDPQGIGSCLTYLRRYGLASIIGICPDDDDDGNAASKPPPQRVVVQTPPAPKPEPAQTNGVHAEDTEKAKDEAVAVIKEACTAKSLKPNDVLLYHYSNSPDITKVNQLSVVDWLYCKEHIVELIAKYEKREVAA